MPYLLNSDKVKICFQAVRWHVLNGVIAVNLKHSLVVCLLIYYYALNSLIGDGKLVARIGSRKG